ncbi:hypothetical protein C8J57DRAFT_1563358 [Mycena rebaudengoi]|nr:hypothetical protein C8J57DRAFT_1563358 [Mycena rebaudengoi]
MSKPRTVIQLHSIRVTSLTNPHDDLPGDMKMSAQLIIDENIFLQTLPVASEHNEMSWKLVAVLRHSETEGTWLVGYVEVGQDKIRGSVELNSFTFEVKLNKVNPDGPSFKFNAAFSVSELASPEVSGLTLIGMLDEKFTSVKGHEISEELLKMYEDSDSMKTPFSMEVPQLVLMHERVLLCYQSNDNRAPWLNILGNILLQSYKASGNVDDLNQTVCAYKDAVRDDPGSVLYLAHLRRSLRHRFEQLGSLMDINRSVMMLETAVEHTAQGDLHKPSLLVALGSSLSTRFERLGGLDDLNQHFQRLSDLNDLTRSVLMLEAAVTFTPDGHPGKPSQLNNLGNSLFCCFERLGRLDDLNQSVSRLEAAVTLTPDGHLDKPSMLGNLRSSLLSRFQQLGDLDDLNQSILRLEAAATLTPDEPSLLNNLGNGHPVEPLLLSNLGNYFFCCFEQLGDLSDLNQAVSKLEAAVTITPDGHPDMPSWLNNLGNSLFGCFERLGDLNDLNQAVSKLEAAVTLAPDGHPEKPVWLANLGNPLQCRFQRLGGLDDLNQAVSRLEAAVTLGPDGHPKKPTQLSSLGNSLRSRFERLGDLNDLTQSVLMLEAAVALTPDGHPNKPSFQNNLGKSLKCRFEQLHDPQDAQQLLLHLTSAACSVTAPANIRFITATQWAQHAHIHEPSLILRAYATAIELLPELAWLGLPITDQHHHLSPAGEVVRDAASAAIAAHDYMKAVEWLDQGRSVIWGQFLDLRTPIDELRESHPGLANQLVSLSTSLETAGTRSNFVADTLKPEESPDSLAKQSHAFVLQRNQVLQQIRDQSGFERFLLSKPFSELLPAAKIGPVAILNISTFGYDALILRSGRADEVMHVPLSDFTLPEAQALAKVLASIVGTPGCSDRLFGFQEGDMAPDDRFPHILSVLWLKIVHPILDALKMTTPVNQDLEHIWWCPTGPLAFLPIHAAGIYGRTSTPCCHPTIS